MPNVFPMGPRRRVILWLVVAAGVTTMLVSLRGPLDKAHMSMAYLLVVLGASANAGRHVGLLISVVCFLAFNFFLLEPYHTFIVHNPLDLLVLATFLVVAVVAAELLARAQRLTQQAERVTMLREANRLKDALLASVSHDLRTPLTSIRALAAEIRSDGDERASLIEADIERLSRMIADLLDLSTLRAGAVVVQPEIASIDDLVGVALQRVSGSEGAERIRVTIGNAELLVGCFDLVHSLRALVNVLENALKYSPREVPVELSATRRERMVIIAVADRGPGIPREDHAHIFQPFYRASRTATAHSGLGLGLAIARDLLCAQGGDLQYTPRDGGGSVFILEIPAADLPAPPILVES